MTFETSFMIMLVLEAIIAYMDYTRHYLNLKIMNQSYLIGKQKDFKENDVPPYVISHIGANVMYHKILFSFFMILIVVSGIAINVDLLFLDTHIPTIFVLGVVMMTVSLYGSNDIGSTTKNNMTSKTIAYVIIISLYIFGIL